MRRIISNLLVFIVFLSLVSLSFAEDKITIVVSGQSHSNLYPCKCPASPSGGVARRATAIKNIKKADKNVLILEAGGSFAGGNFDGSTQTAELDKKRTEFYMQTLVKMGYEAFLISSEEFNFGQDFLSELLSKYKLNYLSANLKGSFLPYIIKKIANMNIVIIGLTDDRVKKKTQIEYIEPDESLSNTLKEIKKDKMADVIIVLAYLDEQASEKLLNKIEGVDIWVSSNNPFRSQSSKKVDNSTLIIPAWEARALTKINITYETDKPLAVDLEHIQLDKEIEDEPEISSIIPACFTDTDCRKEGFSGECKDAGQNKAKCAYSQIQPLKMTVIKPKVCNTCDINSALEKIKEVLPNLETDILVEDSKEAKELIEKLEITMLPVYLIDGSIEKEKVFSQITKIVKKTADFYMLEPSFSGVSFFINREKIPHRLDVFFDIGTKNTVKILDMLEALKDKRKDIDIHINFLAIKDPATGFIAKGGKYEVEEYLRSACINKYYPDKIWYYLSCRFADIESSWWDDCISKIGMDPLKIKGCAQTQEGKSLLEEFTKLTEELEVVFGPTFVINNQEIFSSDGVPTVEEMEKLFR